MMFGNRPRVHESTRQGVEPTSGPAILVQQAVKTYPTPGGDVVAVAGIDLEVRAGEFVAVVGRSGSGKTTLVNLVAGIDRLTSGTVVVDGTDLAALPESRLAAWRGRSVGLVFQFFQLLPTLTVIENVMLPMDLCATVPPRERRPLAADLLAQVGIADHADKLPATLSGGQQQRAAIARALANDPPIVLADEPTGNLDSATGEEVLGLFRQLAGRGRAVLMVTHERDVSSWVTRRVTLDDGRVVADDVLRAATTLVGAGAAARDARDLRDRPAHGTRGDAR